MLRQLGWVKAKSSQRDTPRNSELTFLSKDEVYTFRRELILLFKRPVQFFERVFSDSNQIWVDRCSSLIVEE